jgi:hypothetical protein
MDAAVNLDNLDFAPLLACVEQLLPDAEKLAAWADDGEIGNLVTDRRGNPKEDIITGERLRDNAFGEVGAGLLQRVYSQWYDLVSLIETKFGAEVGFWKGEEFLKQSPVLSLAMLDLHTFPFRKKSFLRISELLPEEEMEWRTAGSSFVLRPGTRLGMSHHLFVRRLTHIAGLLRDIVKHDQQRRGKKRPGMLVEEANCRARELTDTPKKKREFLALSETKQAKRIGCSWATYSKTRFYEEAREKRLLPSSRPQANHSEASRSVATVRLTSALEARTVEGDRDKVLCELVEAEEQEPNRRSWDELPLEERQAIDVEQEVDMAAYPSPLDTRRRRSRRR